MKVIDPQGKRLPIKLDTTSNGEYLPVPEGGSISVFALD